MGEEETYIDYSDMEEELERDEAPEYVAQIWRNMADFYLSQEQLADKGSLLKCYKSCGLRRTYIEVYERAVIGKAETAKVRKPQKIGFGYACLKEAIVEKGILYLIVDDHLIYRIRHLKEAEEAAYRINEQSRKTMG